MYFVYIISFLISNNLNDNMKNQNEVTGNPSNQKDLNESNFELTLHRTSLFKEFPDLSRCI